jgi:hypothetical protein
MAELLAILTSRQFVIACAILGAAIATLGNVLVGNTFGLSPVRARLIVRLGYGITGLSVACFILAGFLAQE